MRRNRDGERIGTRRAERLRAEAACRARLLVAASQRRLRPRKLDPTGIKRQFVPGRKGVHTPYFAKELKRRRAARRVAHEARRVNRA